MTAAASGKADRRERGLAVCYGTTKVSLSEASWKTIRLGDVCRVVPGHAFRSEHWQKTGVPVIKIKNICGDNTIDVTDADCVPEELVTERLSKFVLRDGDILIAMTGATAGKVGKLRTDRPMLLNQRVARIEPVEADRDFVWFVVSSNEYESRFFRLADGAAQPNMSGSQIERVELFLPSLPIQRKIASILSGYDDLIENNTRRNKILEEMARALYREWFVHFRFPGHEEMKMVESELGPIPKGWEVKALGNVLFELESGSRPKGGIRPSERGVPSIGAENILGLGEYDYSREKYVSRRFYDTMRRGHVKSGDVLLYKDGAQIGRKSMFRDGFPHAGCCVNEHVFILRTNGRCSQSYLYFWLDQPNITGKIRNLNANAAQPGINQASVRGLPILLPDEVTLGAFEDLVESLLGQLFSLAKKNNLLRRTRDLLLPKLLSSELDVDQLDVNSGTTHL